MITSIVGRLIKKPELVERIHIPGKRVVAFTVVQNSQRGDRRVSVFFNLSTVVATDAQFEMVMRFEKGTVLLFSSPRITYVKQVDREDGEQVINLYAEIDNFRIVAGAAGGPGSEAAPSPHPADAPAFEEAQEAPGRVAAQRSRPAAPAPTAAAELSDLSDLSDPFGDEPPPRRPATNATAPTSGMKSDRRAAPAAPPGQSVPPRPTRSRRQDPEEAEEAEDPFG